MQRVKYSRTMNLPWSDSDSSDDVWWAGAGAFAGQEVVVTEKLDGECTTIYPDGYVHARSVDSKHHPSRSWVKVLAARVAHDLPPGWRLCGENVYAFHSIYYRDLPTWFFAFGLYDDGNVCRPWSELEEFSQLLDLHTVPVLYKGPWDEAVVRGLWTGRGRYPTFEAATLNPKMPDDLRPCAAEGYVVRLAGAFPYENFSKCCAKYVRPNHVQTDSHWMSRAPVPNGLS